MKKSDNNAKSKNNRVFTNLMDFRNTGTHRFHLRLLNDNRGILNIDAKYVLYFNDIGAEYMKLFISGKNERDIQNYFVKIYKTSRNEVESDYNDILNKLESIISGTGVCPIHGIGITPKAFEVNEFPLRVDFAITYECNNKCPHCYVARKSDFQRLDIESMKKILDTLWDVGVPHIALTGGEPTTRDGFLDLIEYGQKKGFVMGIITNARRFKDPKLVESAIKRGLDYAQMTLESHDPKIHDKMVGVDGAWEETVQAIKNFAQKNIFWMTNTTICKHNVNSILDTVRYIHELGAKTFACNGLIYSGKGKEFQDGLTEKELIPIVDNINRLADELGMRFIWYSPTQYCVLNPIELGLGPKRCSAATNSMGVEPNGDVIPCQSYFEPVGNILKDSWKKLWHSPLFKKIRKYEYVEKKCKDCNMLDICGGGCPLYLESKQLGCHYADF